MKPEPTPIETLKKREKELMCIAEACLWLAFEAGKWEGQVELEEFYDRSQFADAFLEVIYSRKSAMPLKPASTGRTVTVNLRSDKWRDGVRISAKEYVYKALELFNTKIQSTNYETGTHTT